MDLNFKAKDAHELMKQLSAKNFVPQLWDKFLYVQVLLNSQWQLACGKTVTFKNSDELTTFSSRSTLPHISITTYDEMLIINMRTHDEYLTGCLTRNNAHNMLCDYTPFVFVSDEPNEDHKLLLEFEHLKPIFVSRA